MRELSWPGRHQQIAQIVEDQGQWVGLLDGDGVPIMTLPALTDMDWPEARGMQEDVEVTIRSRTPSGRLHPVHRELVAENLGKMDEVSRLVPVTGPPRMVAIVRPGMRRRVMRVSHVEVTGDAHLPRSLTIKGADLLVFLDLLPCPSNPLTWTGAFTRFTRDWVGPAEITETFEHPRDLADMKLITVADGASVEGPADEVIYRLIKESLDAVMRTAKITRDPPYVVRLEDPRVESPYTIMRPTDNTIWQEVGDIALANGVNLSADLWWPGDPVPSGVGVTLRHPTVVFTVRQEV